MHRADVLWRLIASICGDKRRATAAIDGYLRESR
jgi:hypothetical protein